jgi:hypothetical protein
LNISTKTTNLSQIGTPSVHIIRTQLVQLSFAWVFFCSFYSDFGWIQSRFDLKQFLSLNNWNHLLEFLLNRCGWFDDDDWRALVEHADNFKNLKMLNLCKNAHNLFLDQNRISSIK